MFRSTKSDKRFPPLLSPPKKQSPANAPRPQAISVFRPSSAPPSSSLSADGNVPNVSPIVSLNESPSVPATCKMTGSATLDRLRPVEAPNPCRAPSCAPVTAPRHTVVPLRSGAMLGRNRPWGIPTLPARAAVPRGAVSSHPRKVLADWPNHCFICLYTSFLIELKHLKNLT